MEENLQKLEEFRKSIECYERLLLKDAKALYKEMLEEPDEGKKIAIREKIICGLLYKVHEYILTHDFKLLTSSSYDMDDIINNFIEVMIKRIDAGVLLKANSFGYIFNLDFYNDLFEGITSTRIQIYDILEIDTSIFANLFNEYCALKMKDPNATLDMIFDLPCFSYFIGQFKNIPYMRIIFERIFESLINNEENYLDLANDKIKRFAHILLKGALERNLVNVENVGYSDMEDSILQRNFEREATDIVFNECGLSERQKKVMEKYYIEGYSLREIARELHITLNQTRGDVASSLALIRNGRKVKRYVANMPIYKG